MKTLTKNQLQTFALVLAGTGLFGWSTFSGIPAFVLTLVGFVAIPILCFNLVEGYCNTGSTTVYTKNLAIMWAVCVIPFWVYFYPYSFYKQSICFDFMLCILILNKLNAQFTSKAEITGYIILTVVLSLFLSTVPVVPEVLTIVFYKFRQDDDVKKRNRNVLLTILLFTAAATGFTFIEGNVVFALKGLPFYFGLAPLGMFLAIPLLKRYNGKRGRTPVAHMFFYVIYPSLYLLFGVLQYLRGISYFYFFACIQCVLVIVSAVFMWYIGKSRLTGSIVRFTNMIQFSYLFYLGYLMEFTMSDPMARSFALRIQYGAFFLMVASATLFASGYCRIGMPRALQRVIYYVNIIISIFVMVFPNTNELLYSGFAPADTQFYPVDNVRFGILFIMFLGYFGILSFIQICFCLNTVFRTSGAEKLRCLWLMGGIVLPWVSFVLWQLGITKGYQIVNVGILSCIICDMIAMIHYGMTDPIQLASNNFLEHAVDGIMILDQGEHVVYFNDVIRSLLPGVTLDMEASNIFDTGYEDLITGVEQTVAIKKRSYKVVSEPLIEANYLQGYLVRINDITAQIEELNAAKSIGYTDSLTKLSTRRYYELRIQDFFQKSSIGTFFYLDVDDFKHVNDDYSHETGDKVLRALGNSLQDIGGNDYYTCRLGGDEFSMFMPNECRYNHIGSVAQNLIDTFHEHLIDDDLPGHITISVGIATTDSVVVESEESPYMQLYNKADAALYNSKRTGKNRFCFYKEGMEKEEKN